jgi:outer membrane protein OmpA-like peptidoglycan-associated protein
MGPADKCAIGWPDDPAADVSSTSTDPLEWLLRPISSDVGIDRKALAALLLDIARSLRPELRAEAIDVPPVDIRLEQLRTLLIGREIETLSRLRETVEDPERLATAIGRVLPTAFAQASTDDRLGQVLAPSLEKAARSSIRNDPRTLIDILYPLIVPAIRKSIGETIDGTFQSLNETLKHSLTWRGLMWRWEAWRTGTSFAEVVLKHTLVYQIEHVFLIHRHTGLLISHVAAEDAASQDPQLVSSMLIAIQDFVRDSFTGAEHQGLDTLRLGELTLWSEPAPFATLVAVIRGNPPEELHEVLRDALSRIHAERHQALESFDGDSSGFVDIEAELTDCVALRQRALTQTRSGVRWLVPLVGLALLLLGCIWGVRRWQDDRRWDDYVARLRTQAGLVVIAAGRHDGKFMVDGLRDPLAIDPLRVLSEAGIKSKRVDSRWAPYAALDPQIVLKRLQTSLDPSPGVTFNVEHGQIVATGSAPAAWIERARAASQMLPAGTPGLDLSGVRNVDDEIERRWANYVAELHQQPGIVVTEAGQRDGKFQIAGLRDPLAADPQTMLSAAGINSAQVIAHWAPYQGFDPQILLKRLQTSLKPPSTVSFTVDGDRIVAQGSAPSLWLDRAHAVSRMLPPGAPTFDLSTVKNDGDGALGRLREAIQSRTVRFDNNEPLPAPGQDAIVNELADELKDLAFLSSNSRVSTRVVVTGHADSLGKGTANLSLSLARAEAVRAILKKHGVNPDLLAVRGAGALEPVETGASESALSANRRVSFTVGIEEQP